MAKKSANERTFQGELYRIISKILIEKEDIKFNKITQEENIGVGKARFADGLLYSSIDKTKTILFELKNTSWDATDETLVKDIIKKVDRNEYKRKQAAPGLKVTSKAFGTGRRMPLAQRYTR